MPASISANAALTTGWSGVFSREIRIDLLGAGDVVVARQEAAVGVDQAQRLRILGVGELEAAQRLRRDRRARRRSARRGSRGTPRRWGRRCGRRRRARAAGRPRPAKAQAVSSSEVTSRALPASPAASCARAAGYWPLPKARTASARRASELVGSCDDDAVGQAVGVLGVAARQRRGEGALDEVEVVRIGAQRLVEIDRGGVGVAVGAGDDGGKVVAGFAGGELVVRGVGKTGERRRGEQRREQRGADEGCLQGQGRTHEGAVRLSTPDRGKRESDVYLGISSPRCTAGRASARSSQRCTRTNSLHSTRSPAP